VNKARSDDYVGWSKKGNVPTILERIDPDIAWLMGYFAADGNVVLGTLKAGGRVRFTVANHEAASLDEYIRQTVERKFGLISKTPPEEDSIKNEHGAYNIVYNSSAWADWIYRLDLKHSVPSAVFESGEDIRCAYIRGFFDGDGSADDRRGFRCGNESKRLIRGIQLLLLGSGIESHVGVDNRGTFSLNVRGPVGEANFSSRIGFRVAHKALAAPIRDYTRSHWKYGVSAFDGLSEAPPCQVWDLEVEDVHRFSAGGLCVHNCHIGLGVTALNTQRVLRRAGIHCDAISAQTAKELYAALSRLERSDPTRPIRPAEP
jgi:hypothetical protein